MPARIRTAWEILSAVIVGLTRFEGELQALITQSRALLASLRRRAR